jgi:hypothetical protein
MRCSVATDSQLKREREMAKVSIRKEDLARVLKIAERTAKRTNERVVVAHDRVELQDEGEDREQHSAVQTATGLNLL